MKAFVIGVVLLTCGSAPWEAERAGAQGVDSTCLALWQYCSQYNVQVPWGISVDSAAKLNPDSLRVDTCEGTLTYARDYAKRTFEVYFQYYIFPDSGYYIDTLVTRHWQEINTSFPGIRKQMQVIEQRFGQFTLWRRFNYRVAFDDTASFLYKRWFFNFDQYVSVDSMRAYLGALPEIDSNVNGEPEVFFDDGLILETGGGGSGVALDSQPESRRVFVWPQPCTNEIFLKGTGPIATPEIMDMLGRPQMLPIQIVNDSTLRIDLTPEPSGILFLKFPQQIIKIIVRK